MSDPNNAPLPVPTGWKPSQRNEIIALCSMSEIQLGNLMQKMPGEDTMEKAELYIVLQFISLIETAANR